MTDHVRDAGDVVALERDARWDWQGHGFTLTSLALALDQLHQGSWGRDRCGHRGGIESVAALVEPMLVRQGSWTSDVAVAVTRHLQAYTDARSTEGPWPWGSPEPYTVRAVHAAWALLSGDVSHLSAHELATYARAFLQKDDGMGGHGLARSACEALGVLLTSLRRLATPARHGTPSRPWYPELGLRAAALARMPPAPHLTDAHVAFSFPWRTRRKGARTGQVTHVSEGRCAIESVSVDKAPVVLGLRTMDETWLAVRRHEDGTFLRPVLAPGTWSPVGVAEFARSARGLPSWADNPFVPLPRSGTTRLPLHEPTVHACCPVTAPITREQVEDRDRAFAAAVASAGRLVEVDGVVHRSTDWPTLHLVETTDVTFGTEAYPREARLPADAAHEDEGRPRERAILVAVG